jgi:hypothetical protein
VSSILFPIAAQAYKNGNIGVYGAMEVDIETGEPVWTFDSVSAGYPVAELYDTPDGVKHDGFRPSSVHRLPGGETLVAGWRRVVWVDEDGEVSREETQSQFNDIHEVQPTRHGTYLVAVTGMDTIYEFDEDWNQVWCWRMWDHVDPVTRPNGYYPNLFTGADVTDMAFHPDGRYHLNYATDTGPDTILCSALNYGVFYLDRETGDVTASNTALSETHNPYEVKQGDLVVPESGRDRVIRTDMSGVTDVLFEGGLSFVKDADPLPDSDRWLLTDTHNDRVLLWEEGAPHPDEEYVIAGGAKPYEADFLTGSDSFA